MKYKFPVIKNIHDVLHAVDESQFVVADKGNYTVINYHYASPEVFPDITNDGSEEDEIAKIRREFRGLIFDKNGDIIRRPFHKFFNIGERHDTQITNIDVSQRHIIYDKLDGSMIAPYQTGPLVYWGTKMGETDVTKQVDPFIMMRPEYNNLAIDLFGNNFTPIFEWMSRKQRIVLDYKEDQLVLTAIRHMHTGEYVTHGILEQVGKNFNVPVCDIFDDTLSQDFLNDTRSKEDVEGYVIRFDDGHMAKIKSEWYVALHRVKSDIAYERGVVKILLNEQMDDLKPLMPKDDLEEIEVYETAFWHAFGRYTNHIKSMLTHLEEEQISRKDFALGLAEHICTIKKSIIFKLFDKGKSATYEDIDKHLKEILLPNCARNSKFDILRRTELFKSVPIWRGVDINE